MATAACLILGCLLSGSVDAETPKGLVVVPVMVAGKELRMIWDTGAELTVVDSKVAQDLELKEVGAVTAAGIGGTQEAATLQQIALEGYGQPVLVQPVALSLRFVRSALRSRVDGILGCDFSRKRVVEFAPETKKVSWWMPGTQPPPEGALRIPVDTSPGRPHVQVKVDHNGEKSLEAILDTGNDQFLAVPQAAAEEWGADLSGHSPSTAGVGGPTRSRTFRAASLKIGQVTVEGPMLTSYASRTPEHARPLLGMKFLAGRRFRLDWQGSALYLWPPQAALVAAKSRDGSEMKARAFSPVTGGLQK